MNEEKREQPNKAKREFVIRIVIVTVLTLMLAASAVFAWFYLGRKATAMARISNPVTIYINAGNKEDIRYMNLGGIDVENGLKFLDANSNGVMDVGENKYEDFVFCVRGENVSQYKLQLAYTTNNQFEYELYRATTDTQVDPKGFVVYTTHDPDPDDITYYIPNGASALAGTKKNYKTVNGETLGKKHGDYSSGVNYHEKTYDTYGNADENDAVTSNDKVNKYAEPIYWQSDDNIPGHPEGNAFEHYYIIRVIWKNTAKNTKETDIIYISATVT